ncbi:sigma 54-interacting transcriptional regulator [Desulforamulus ruminis]|uniref:sigma 54-interacting transcriptional regulator n=1 Tax=Desulforamulus ruminis TaxID=1564 RepID=UPI0023525C69|nr:sigma 54-interacting transcriptional regulator [Desulforamulus ruminis]
MQAQEIVIQIHFVDRLGLAHEILEIFKNEKINLLGMEAQTNQVMMVKFACPSDRKLQRLMAELKKINGIQAVAQRDQMPYEHREHQLETILNSVSEGILAVDSQGQITHINDVACQILDFSREKVLGKTVEELFSIEIPIQETLKTGRSYRFTEIKMKKGSKVIHYLTSGVPVINEKGQIMGAVATVKDYRQVEEILSKVELGNKRLTTFDDIVHQSGRMRQLVETAKIVARGNSTILLRGESGTGKELFARAIHMESHRSLAPFIAVNCAALPETLLESELFGYEEGAFTGAARGGKKGLFEQAENGTLFLDEIGELSPHMQVRLLRVLQESTIRKIGGILEIPVNVRIIAATHRNLEEMVRQKTFREDLYYRLDVIPLRIPPLRERPEDIPLTAQHLVRKICARLGKPEKFLTKESADFLMNQTWPGNVRQLENTLERIINVSDSTEILPRHFNQWASTEPGSCILQGNGGRGISVPLGDKIPPLKEIVGEVEKQVLQHVLEKYPSSRKAGNVLGVSNTTILNKIKTYDIILTEKE